jgi:hypothetical protein
METGSWEEAKGQALLAREREVLGYGTMVLVGGEEG